MAFLGTALLRPSPAPALSAPQDPHTHQTSRGALLHVPRGARTQLSTPLPVSRPPRRALACPGEEARVPLQPARGSSLCLSPSRRPTHTWAASGELPRGTPSRVPSVPPLTGSTRQGRGVAAYAVDVRVAVPLGGGAEAAEALVGSGESEEEAERRFQEEWVSSPKRICIFVEPSPFDYVCGYKNRFQNFIRNLQEGGDEVLVVTTHKGAPEEFHGAKVFPSWSFSFPFYKNLPVSFGLSPRILKRVADFQPDIIHATSPGIMCFGAMVIAKILSKPLVFSYHTHVPAYIPKYTFAFLVHPMWAIIRFLHHRGDITLTTSQQLGQELLREGALAGRRECVWPKGIDCEIFNPSFRNDETRAMLAGGEPEKPLLVHVGRLGAEKNLALLRPLLDALPGVRLAFVGDGPYREELETIFEGTPTVFTGMLSGDALSSAYASGDVFLMPSETETLGFVVLEAMASGLPVVAARAGGIPDIISKDGVTGFLFEPGSVEEAVEKVRALLASPELRARVGEAGRAEVERFDWRAATRSVRQSFYSSAVWLFLRKRMAGWSRFLPWWLKKSEWKTVFG